MNCPRCHGTIVPRKIRQIEVNVCSGCGGTFLRRGELNRVAEPTAGDLEFSTVEGESFQHDDEYGAAGCPACTNTRMRKVEFNIHTNVILDFCEDCEGFWLDARELERINGEVRRLNTEQTDGDEPPMLWFARFIWSLPR